MKTRHTILIAALMSFSTIAFAGNPTSRLVVYQSNAESFKVLYEGAQAGEVTVKIFDKNGSLLFQEATNGLSKFMLPVSFDGMQPGEYTFTVTDESGTQTQHVNYHLIAQNTGSIQSLHIGRTKEDGKYIMSVTSDAAAQIHVEILDATGNVIHEEDQAIGKSFGLVFNLKQFQGTPTFRVTDAAGKSIVK